VDSLLQQTPQPEAEAARQVHPEHPSQDGHRYDLWFAFEQPNIHDDHMGPVLENERLDLAQDVPY
jgi:hypothetical protein